MIAGAIGPEAGFRRGRQRHAEAAIGPAVAAVEAGPAVAADPVAADPVAADPVAADPVAADPVAADPVAADPVAAEAAGSRPDRTRQDRGDSDPRHGGRDSDPRHRRGGPDRCPGLSQGDRRDVRPTVEGRDVHPGEPSADGPAPEDTAAEAAATEGAERRRVGREGIDGVEEGAVVGRPDRRAAETNGVARSVARFRIAPTRGVSATCPRAPASSRTPAATTRPSAATLRIRSIVVMCQLAFRTGPCDEIGVGRPSLEDFPY